MTRTIPATLALLGFFLLAAGLQERSGAYRSELAGHSDEPAHFVTGLLVRDYLATGLGSSPRLFAEDYYSHYPKVALGHWPPAFYALLGLWFLAFGASIAAALVLMALLPALLAWTVCLVVRANYGWVAGVTAGAACVAIPCLQDGTTLVMSDSLTALVSLWATLLWGRYLANPGYRAATLFGLCAALALLCKASGLALAISAPLAVAFTGRWRLCGKASFWLPVGIVLAICLPWYLATLDLALDGVHSPPLRLSSIARALLTPPWVATQQLGFVFCAAAALGMVSVLWRRAVCMEQRVALLAYLPAFAVVHGLFVTGAFSPRYLTLVVPALLVFAADGIAWLCVNLASLRPLARVPQWATAAVLVVGVVAGVPWRVVHKEFAGYADVAARVLEQSAEPPRILISSAPRGEGAFIAAAALQDRNQPRERRCTILRGSQLLASSTWTHQNYRLRYRTPDEVLVALREAQVGAIVVDLSQPAKRRTPDQRLLADALLTSPSEWRQEGEFPLTREQNVQPRGLAIFVREAAAPAP